MDAAFIEGYRRLIEKPEAIKDSVLFGELLVKAVRLRQDLVGVEQPRAIGDVFITLKAEIDRVGNPALRQEIRDRVFATYDAAMRQLEAHSDTDGVVDVAGTPIVVEPVPSAPSRAIATPRAVVQSNQPDEVLWTDPALD